MYKYTRREAVTLLSVRRNISLPEELDIQLREYNRANRYNKIDVSKVAQAALYEVLMDKISAKCTA